LFVFDTTQYIQPIKRGKITDIFLSDQIFSMQFFAEFLVIQQIRQ